MKAGVNKTHKVVVGFKNKAMVGMSNVVPETMVAAQMNKMQQSKEEDKKNKNRCKQHSATSFNSIGVERDFSFKEAPV